MLNGVGQKNVSFLNDVLGRTNPTNRITEKAGARAEMSNVLGAKKIRYLTLAMIFFVRRNKFLVVGTQLSLLIRGYTPTSSPQAIQIF